MYGSSNIGRLSFVALVCFYLSVAAFPVVAQEGLYRKVNGVWVRNTGPINPAASGTSYVYNTTNPRYTYIPANSSYPQPSGSISATFDRNKWGPLALKALKRTPAAFALFYAADSACELVDCNTLFWGQDMTLLTNFPGYTTNSTLGTGFGSAFFNVSGSSQVEAWSNITTAGQNALMSQLNTSVINGRPVATWLSITPGTNGGYTFRTRYVYTDISFTCPSGYNKVGSSCVATNGGAGATIPFDESYFADAVPMPNDSAEALQLNQALLEELLEAQADGVMNIVADPVTETKTSTSLVEGVETVTEVIDTYSFPVTNNNTISPTIVPTKTTVTNVYQGGSLVSTNTSTEVSGGSGGQPPASSTVPTDCDFFPTICEFINWFKSPPTGPEPDFSQVMGDDPQGREYVFPGGSGSCPAPYALTVMGSPQEFSYEFICDFAVQLSTLVMIASYLLSATILIRASKP